MKVICLLLAIAFAPMTHAQDFCKLLKKEVQDNTIFDFNSPFDPADIPAVRVTRSYNTNPDYASDNFFLTFYTESDLESIYTTVNNEQVEKEEKKLVVEFEDKTTIVDEAIQINHDRTDDKLRAVRYVYLNVTDKNMADLTTKKITKFSMAGHEQTVPADSANAVMHYVQCMRDAKK